MTYFDIFISKAGYKLLKQFKRSPIKTDGYSTPESQLQELHFIKQDLRPVDKTRLALPAGTFSITQEGLNYIEWRKTRSRELWLKNAWIPIVVSFVTTLITNYILPLLPQILQWISSFLSKFSS